jgi:enoyl-[acyl-carrier protein] reductase I
MIDLKGQTAVVFGLANKRSIAWAIAQKLSAAGAQIAICYQNERLRPEAESLAGELPDAAVFQCDVSSDEQIDAVFVQLKERYGKINTLVHSVQSSA